MAGVLARPFPHGPTAWPEAVKLVKGPDADRLVAIAAPGGT
jgi:hypothetical protein